MNLRKARFAQARFMDALWQWQRDALRRSEGRDARAMAEWAGDRARRDGALGARVLTRSQQYRRAFHNIPACDWDLD
jgi:hypothetical protein